MCRTLTRLSVWIETHYENQWDETTWGKVVSNFIPPVSVGREDPETSPWLLFVSSFSKTTSTLTWKRTIPINQFGPSLTVLSSLKGKPLLSRRHPRKSVSSLRSEGPYPKPSSDRFTVGSKTQSTGLPYSPRSGVKSGESDEEWDWGGVGGFGQRSQNRGVLQGIWRRGMPTSGLDRTRSREGDTSVVSLYRFRIDLVPTPTHNHPLFPLRHVPPSLPNPLPGFSRVLGV